jgi:hypothetical protein
MAQVYSVNVVGYVNVTVLPNKLALLANPLNNNANDISTVLPLPETADGTAVYRFNVQNQAFGDALLFIGGLGWVNSGTGNPAADVLAPGEGFFIQAPPSPAPALNLTFVGEVPQGDTLTVPLAGQGRLTITGSIVPQEAPLGDTAIFTTGTMQFPAFDGDIVYIWDAAGQTYLDGWSFIGATGWAQIDLDHLQGPSIPVATGFWISKNIAAPAVNWVRSFHVN